MTLRQRGRGGWSTIRPVTSGTRRGRSGSARSFRARGRRTRGSPTRHPCVHARSRTGTAARWPRGRPRPSAAHPGPGESHAGRRHRLRAAAVRAETGQPPVRAAYAGIGRAARKRQELYPAKGAPAALPADVERCSRVLESTESRPCSPTVVRPGPIRRALCSQQSERRCEPQRDIQRYRVRDDVGDGEDRGAERRVAQSLFSTDPVSLRLGRTVRSQVLRRLD